MKKDILEKSNKRLAPDIDTTLGLHQRIWSKSRGILFRKKFIIVSLIGLVSLAILGFGIKSYLDLRHTKQELEAIKNNPNQKTKEEVRDIIDKVGKLVILPQNEDPTIATVTDPAKLSDQPFFANSKSGDKVLIYQEASRAVLYRPSENKVIEIAPLNLTGQNSVTPSVDGSAQNAPTNETNRSVTR